MISQRVSAALGLALSLGALTSCVWVSTTRIAASQPAIQPDSVTVFATQKPEKYTEVAVLRSHRFLVSDAKTLNELREKAASLGANGILLVNASAPSYKSSGGGIILGGGRSAGNVIIGNGDVHLDDFERAIAIRWTAP